MTGSSRLYKGADARDALLFLGTLRVTLGDYWAMALLSLRFREDSGEQKPKFAYRNAVTAAGEGLVTGRPVPAARRFMPPRATPAATGGRSGITPGEQDDPGCQASRGVSVRVWTRCW